MWHTFNQKQKSNSYFEIIYTKVKMIKKYLLTLELFSIKIDIKLAHRIIFIVFCYMISWKVQKLQHNENDQHYRQCLTCCAMMLKKRLESAKLQGKKSIPSMIFWFVILSCQSAHECTKKLRVLEFSGIHNISDWHWYVIDLILNFSN